MPAPIAAGAAAAGAGTAGRAAAAAGAAGMKQAAATGAKQKMAESGTSMDRVWQIQQARRRQRQQQHMQQQKESETEQYSAPFPVIPFALALIIDMAELTGINYWLFYLPNIVAASILFPWAWLKRKPGTPPPISRVVVIWIIEWIPGLGSVMPGWTAFVVRTWWKQRA